jgi:tRNA(fMet)-specific endonuclease VapC
MSLHLLDTDHISLIQYRNQKVIARWGEFPVSDVAVSIISYEEQFRGWLNVIKRAQTPDRFEEAYRWLGEFERLYCRFRILGFDRSAATMYETLRQTHRRAGKMDLRIAAIALSTNATLVTRNTQDFITISNLSLDNWA